MKELKLFFVRNVVLLLCICGFVINFCTFYPGFLSPDSLDQYGQSLSGKYATWHPPIMAFIWHLLNYFYNGPQLMLALQLFFLWAACYLFATSFDSKRARCIIFILFLVGPFIQNFAGWILKDTQMAYSWLLAAAILFRKIRGRDKVGPFTIIFTALLLLYGSWLRYNAITALAPLCIIWAWIMFKNAGKMVKMIYALLLMAIIFFGQNIFNERVLKAEKQYTEAQIYFHDLTGIFVVSHKNVYPSILYENPEFDTNYVKRHYNPIDVTALLWNTDNKQILIMDKRNTGELKKSWIKAIKASPALYLKNRYDIYLSFLTIKKKADLQYYFKWISPNKYGFKVNGNNPMYKLYGMYISGQGGYIYFQVWFWVFLNAVLFGFTFMIRMKIYRLYYACIVSSGFLYTLPQFVVSNTVRDFRYIYWSCFACIIAVITIIADHLLAKRAKTFPKKAHASVAINEKK